MTMASTQTRPAKQRRNLTFSPEAAAFLDASDNASATADAAVLAAMRAQAEHDALKALVAELDAQYGPADQAGVERAIAMLS